MLCLTNGVMAIKDLLKKPETTGYVIKYSFLYKGIKKCLETKKEAVGHLFYSSPKSKNVQLTKGGICGM